MGSNKEIDPVHYDAILTDVIRRENNNIKLNTKFQINPGKFNKKMCVISEKPLCNRPTEKVPECPAFIEMFCRDQLPPNKKYKHPLTEAHEIGWHVAPLDPSHREETLQEWLAIFTKSDADCTRPDCPLSSAYRRRQDPAPAAAASDRKRLDRPVSPSTFNKVTHRENLALIKSKQEEALAMKRHNHMEAKKIKQDVEDALREEREKAHGRRRHNQAVAEYHLEQIRRKKQAEEEVRQWEREEIDPLRHWIRRGQALDPRDLERRQAEVKKCNRKMRLDDIARHAKVQKEAELLDRSLTKSARSVHAMLEERKLGNQQMKEKVNQRIQRTNAVMGKLADVGKTPAPPSARRKEAASRGPTGFCVLYATEGPHHRSYQGDILLHLNRVRLPSLIKNETS